MQFVNNRSYEELRQRRDALRCEITMVRQGLHDQTQFAFRNSGGECQTDLRILLEPLERQLSDVAAEMQTLLLTA